MNEKLSQDFYMQDTIEVARQLLGATLVHVTQKGQRISGRIVETEAYLGAQDPACHGFGYRLTPRTQALFMPGGHSYIYFIYGMYNLFNVVTARRDEPEAVLIRALEPLEGIDWMSLHRPVKNPRDLTNGPGKLSQAFGFDTSLSGLPLTGDKIFIEVSGQATEEPHIVSGPRVGIDYAGDAAHWPLRFAISNHSHLSSPKL